LEASGEPDGKIEDMKVLPFDSVEVSRATILWLTGAEEREMRRSAAKRVETQPVPGEEARNGFGRREGEVGT
jgi:hypothetical protein